MYKYELSLLEQSACDDNIIYWILKETLINEFSSAK